MMKRIKDLFVAVEGGRIPLYKAIFNILIMCAVIVLIFWISLSRLGLYIDFSFISEFRTRISKGYLMTIELSAAVLVLSLAIGVLCAAGQSSRVLAVRYLCKMYVGFIRGTPLIMQIYLFFYIICTAWGIADRFIAGVLILSIFEGAYITEIIRGSLISLDPSQLEAAKAVGFTRRQTLLYVILPQLVARTLPALTGQFASIVKDSSLLSIIAVSEIAQSIREISATNFQFFACYIFLGVLYLCVTLPATYVSKMLEKRFRYE